MRKKTEEKLSDRNFSIAVIRGDGIGIEVVEEGLKVLRAVDDRAALGLEFTEFPWGRITILSTAQ